MSMIYSSDLSKVFRLCTVLLHVFDAGVSENYRSQRSVFPSWNLAMVPRPPIPLFLTIISMGLSNTGA